MQQCQVAFDNFRAVATLVVGALTAGGILLMVNLTQPAKEPPARNGYWCRRHGVPEDECRGKHGPGDD